MIHTVFNWSVDTTCLQFYELSILPYNSHKETIKSPNNPALVILPTTVQLSCYIHQCLIATNIYLFLSSLAVHCPITIYETDNWKHSHEKTWSWLSSSRNSTQKLPNHCTSCLLSSYREDKGSQNVRNVCVSSHSDEWLMHIPSHDHRSAAHRTCCPLVSYR